ncbi:ATP-binding protein [Ruminococcus sp. HUN007]|uniref:ATP-binding protein n=1 Tax=Ruminococcus sp. HUN007 TaxID=1514668 RepID=UPI0005D1D1F2|nr:ATP-binding protein [Ruminococcus sp. HUN007]
MVAPTAQIEKKFPQQMLHGGISDPRNKTLMKMFNMIGIGERAGSGIPDIYQVWENEGWKLPVVEERYNPDRTILLLEFVENEAKKASEESKRRKQAKTANDENKRINKAEKTSEENKRRKQAKKTSEENKRRKTEDNYKAIREYLRKNGLSKTNEIAEAIGLSSSRTRVILKEMPDVEYEGTNTNRKYRLKEQL